MKLRRISIVLTAIAGVVLTACQPTPATEVASIAPTVAPVQISTQAPTDNTTLIENGTYLIDGQSITLVDGVAESEAAPGSASKQITRYFGNAVEVDLNADGMMDSVFLLQQENGGSGVFYYVAAAIKTADGYTGTNAIFLGDRIAPQSTNVNPNDLSQIVVNYADRNPGEPMSASPSLGVSKTFKFENGSLVEVPAPAP